MVPLSRNLCASATDVTLTVVPLSLIALPLFSATILTPVLKTKLLRGGSLSLHVPSPPDPYLKRGVPGARLAGDVTLGDPGAGVGLVDGGGVDTPLVP